MWHQHSGCRHQTYFKHAQIFMNAGKGTCWKSSQLNHRLWWQISLLSCPLCHKFPDLGLQWCAKIWGSSSLAPLFYCVVSTWRFPINGGHTILKLLVSFARFPDMLSPINIHVSLKLKRICCQSEHSSATKLVQWRFGHTTHFYKPEHSNICHHFCTIVVQLAKCPLLMHLS